MSKGGSELRERADDLLCRYAAGERHFAGADLGAVELDRADLRQQDLSGADLSGANLGGARLYDVNLSAANLRDANLSGANLYTANLRDANLSGANLGGADLSGADLSGADLSGADLNGADLSGADLRGARLYEVNLNAANLRSANLSGASLGGAKLAMTVLVDIDMSPLCDAQPPVLHYSSSIVDFRSIISSLRSPNLKTFLQHTGMPEVFVEFDVSCAESLDGSIIKKMLRSTFISYGDPDEPFARKLYEALHRNGVTTFFFAEHATPGDKLHRMMRTKINEHDRVILVCSRASLDRKGVLNEIEETLAREARDGGAAYLIPIRLDGYVFSGWTPPNPDPAQSVRDRVVADFEGADSDPAKFDAGLLKLIAALKK